MNLSWNPYTSDDAKPSKTTSLAASPPVSELEGRVYIARIPEGFYKIGSSHLPMKRMREIAWEGGYSEVKYPDEVQPPSQPALLHCFPANGSRKSAENALHKLATHHGWHVNGEWFRLPEQAVIALTSINAYDEPYFHSTKDLFGAIVPEGGLNNVD